MHLVKSVAFTASIWCAEGGLQRGLFNESKESLIVNKRRELKREEIGHGSLIVGRKKGGRREEIRHAPEAVQGSLGNYERVHSTYGVVVRGAWGD